MSVGKTADDGNVSIFTRNGVTVYKEEYVIITCQRKPILIGNRDECGRYRIWLNKYHRQWQPCRPTKESKRKLHQAHSVCNLLSKEESIKGIHAVCWYPVSSTWIKSIKAGTYVGFPMLIKYNVIGYYPENNETPKRHLNQWRKIVRSIKLKRTTLEGPKTATLQGHKARDVYIRVYEVRNTVFSGYIWKLPTRSQIGK